MVLFNKHLRYFLDQKFPEIGFNPSGNPIQLGNLIGQGMQLWSDIGQVFLTYSPFKSTVHLNPRKHTHYQNNQYTSLSRTRWGC